MKRKLTIYIWIDDSSTPEERAPLKVMDIFNLLGGLALAFRNLVVPIEHGNYENLKIGGKIVGQFAVKDKDLE